MAITVWVCMVVAIFLNLFDFFFEIPYFGFIFTTNYNPQGNKKKLHNSWLSHLKCKQMDQTHGIALPAIGVFVFACDFPSTKLSGDA